MYGMFLLGVGTATTSCEDMFTADNNLVTTDLAPKDTLYQMMGIVKSMQKLADRTVLLGEIRADLVDIDPLHSTKDLQELASNSVSLDNIYNKPADYYAVINNCNVYLANVDSMRNSQGTEKYFEKEICATKCFRAWCYLELLKNYGKVPFVTEPVLTSDQAEDIVANAGQYADMKTILDFCIDDLKGYAFKNKNNELRQSYGNQTYYGDKYQLFFLPVRIVLAELYLWRGSYTGETNDYVNAARMYHDYFTFSGEEKGVLSTYRSRWTDDDFQSWSSSYMSSFGGADDYEAVIPMDTAAYYGNTCDVKAVFNSTYGNDYYPAAIPSQQLERVSKAQKYCLFINSDQMEDIKFNPEDENHYGTFKSAKGDLRYFSIYGINTSSNFEQSKYNSNFSPTIYGTSKYSTSTTDRKEYYIPLYRRNILYLHMAEALNRAGFPETAYAVLKYGLTRYVMDNYISEDEFNRLCEIKSWGFSPSEPLYLDKPELSAKANGSFVIWPSTVFGTQVRGGGTSTVYGPEDRIQVGIHSIGSGDTEKNYLYYLDDEATLAAVKDTLDNPLPTPPGVLASEEEIAQYEADMEEFRRLLVRNAEIREENKAYLASPEVRAKRQARVSQLLLEEEILEGMFEGYRFYDLMRFQMQELGGEGIGSAITLPAHYVGNDLYKGTESKLSGKPWYLPLPKR